tara:strand:+ start:1682 stop:1936 length:255 start_codon:yes stop_codon:yes gene_type:complete
MAIGNAFNRNGGTGRGGGSSDGTIQKVTFTNQTSLTITHDFDNYPNVIIIDDAGSLIHAEVQYSSNSQILINFAASISGTVIIR